MGLNSHPLRVTRGKPGKVGTAPALEGVKGAVNQDSCAFPSEEGELKGVGLFNRNKAKNLIEYLDSSQKRLRMTGIVGLKCAFSDRAGVLAEHGL
jgi:hypothetical protein